jgi:hypothetical protein
MWGTLSDERTVCNLQLLLALASTVALGSKSRRTHDHIYCLRFKTPSTWRVRSPIYIPQEQGGPRHWVPFVASYNSQGYGGGIRTPLHTGILT